MSKLVQYHKIEEALWRAPDGGHVFIEPEVLQVIARYIQSNLNTPESGGLLAGHYKGIDFHVTNLTVPLEGDLCGRYHFHRRSPSHVQQMKNWYLNSGGKINCLGEWHTHPETYPTPSSIDINSWKTISKERNGLSAIFLILGSTDVWVGSVT